MPIYAYRCASCGHAQDVLQKMSDPLLTVCPACGAATFSKQLTAAGFQLKGSGWYVTDFRGGNTGAKKDGAADAAADKAVDKPASTPTDGAGAGAKADKPATADKAAPAPAAAPAPSTPPST
jgi:putative FmdB family regulatory protein